MGGTKIGGKKAAIKNLARDPNFYVKMGVKGGKAKVPKGFALNPELARQCGAKIGRISKRGHKYIETRDGYNYYIELATGNMVKKKANE